MDIKLAWHNDMIEQIGRDIYFDLVNFDKVLNFHVPKQMLFYQFKERVAKELSIPVQFQRFWLWENRINQTYRPARHLTLLEESTPVVKLREHSDRTSNRLVLRLFLEVELDLDLRPIAPPQKTEEDILLFFKLYDPWKEELRYVGRLFVKLGRSPDGILRKLRKMAGFNSNEEIKLFEEIKFEPCIMCIPIDIQVTFLCSELKDGDIICFQKLQGIEQCHCPDVPSFFEYLLEHKGGYVKPSSHTINTDALVTELSPSQSIITQEESTQVDICTQAVTHVTLLTKSSQLNEQNAVEVKMTSIPSTPVIVDPQQVHPHQVDRLDLTWCLFYACWQSSHFFLQILFQERNVVEAASYSSSLASFDALFADIQSLLEVKAVEAGSSSRLQRSMLSIDEISNANKIVKQCLDMKLGSFISSGRTREFKNSVSIMLTVNSFPDNKVDEITKFLDEFNQTCERYVGAEQDTRVAEQKVSSIMELKTTLKQLSSKFIPTRNRVEEVDREIADMERQLAERKEEKAQLHITLEDLAGKATASRQALINAELDVNPLWIKKEEAEKTVDDIDKSWESLKDYCLLLQ
ncbi:uncharacterized protein LOC115710792 isoform X1 [Cannabis sativa]|uniref:uncharacterized protein LOC115710792 isoform X1 n=1 Tax=Cannabis sativa TaxID=3483 RepID=UPI0029CA9B54|nr:uncharacterized protein LOC115710792 isoform X1 [Cannabis sativa]